MLPIATSKWSRARGALLRVSWVGLALVAHAACSGGSTGTTPSDAGAKDGRPGDGSRGDGGSHAESGPGKESGPPVQRGPSAIPIANSDPNGLYWDAANSTLYIADNQNDRVMTWTDTGGFKVLVNLPGPTGNEVGGIVGLSDGTLVVPEFGFGTSGLVAVVNPKGMASSVPHLDPTKRRLGIAVASDGTLYDSFFDKVTSGYSGFVAKLDIVAGTETTLIMGLMKPVGVAVIGTTLYISDQDAGEILAAPLSKPTSYKALSTMLTPDLLSVGPNDTLFSGSPTGVVYQINTSTGSYNTLFTAGGTLQTRGSAYDAANRRLFVAEHDSSGVTNYVEIVPVGG